jgi:hypothetical protein
MSIIAATTSPLFTVLFDKLYVAVRDALKARARVADLMADAYRLGK